MKRPQNCGTGYCSCIECVMEPAQQKPVAMRDVIVVNLVREGINKHKARELADHFVSLTSPPAQQCKWPTCQSEEYQQDLAEQIKRELVGEQPAQQEPVAWMHQIDCDRDDRDDFMAYYKQTPGYCIPLYTSPPAQSSVPDAIHHTDTSETLEYIQGWNDCRQLMLEMRKP